MFTYVYLCLPLFTTVYLSLLMFAAVHLCMFTYFDPCLHVFTYVYTCLAMFTPFYLCWPNFIYDNPCIQVFTYVYPCLLIFPTLYSSIPMCTPIYLPLHVFCLYDNGRVVHAHVWIQLVFRDGALDWRTDSNFECYWCQSCEDWCLWKVALKWDFIFVQTNEKKYWLAWH